MGNRNVSTGWLPYFDGLVPDSPLHREQAARYVESLAAEVGLRGDERILDFGCGFGFVAALVAPRVAEVRWWDPAPNMRALAERNTADAPNARPCDLSAWSSADPGAVQWGDAPFDLILVNSVAQYMRPEELWDWLARWRAMIASHGRIVLSDLIPVRHSIVSDVADLVRFGARLGSPIGAVKNAVGGLGRYWRTSRAAPLVRVAPHDLARRAAEAGLSIAILPRNLTHFSKRWTAVLRPS